MKKNFTRFYGHFSKAIFAILLGIFLAPISLTAQQLKRSDFVLYGVKGVQISTSNTIANSGRVGSNLLIKSTGNVQFTGSLHSGGRVELANGNIVNGSISAANVVTPPLTGNILATGSGLSVSKDLIVNGNISIAGGTISGIVYQPSGAAYVGPTANKQLLTTQMPTLPAMPQNSNITISGTPPSYKNNVTLLPGSVSGDITLGGNKSITFSGPGTYTINSITLTNSNTFIFDLKGTSTGKFNILVKGNMSLAKVATSYINAPAGTTNTLLATRIYTETQGTGNSNGNSFEIANGSSSSQSRWLGTVWAPNGSITIGSGTGNTDLTGALFGGQQVYINSGVTINYSPLVSDCVTPTAAINNNATTVDIGCTVGSISLTGTTNITNPIYSWTTANGNIVSGQGTASITVSTAGKYTLTVTNADGCTATDDISVTSCVNGAVDGNPFKVETVVDAVLTQLTSDSYTTQQKQDLFIFDPSDPTRVLIEAILQDNNITNATNYLVSNGFNQTGISNNPSYYIITGFYAISKLLELNQHPDLYKYIRAVTPPVTFFSTTGGLYKSGGDSAMQTRSARAGYNITGSVYKAKDGTVKPIKIGVISDSYNKKGAAATDVSNGDLPADVDLGLGDYPFAGSLNDEGRAMMQIVYEEAPGAKLAFRTGFLSEGDMAEGIRQLRDRGCNIIVDDITYASAPFFRDGLITKAVQDVTRDSVLYFTSAGNFSNKAYEGKFKTSLSNGKAVPLPTGDTLQKIRVNAAGSYIIVLQWDDDFYSTNVGSLSNTGAKFDVDVYLTDYTGKNILGYNRINTGSDPLEVLPFSVVDATTVYLKVVKANGPTTGADIAYKYILFKGSGSILDAPNANPSTIIGHANAKEAITVGAVQYNLTPAYGVAANLMKPEPFSSWGGPTNGVDNRKPDFSAPDGVNTSVTLGDRPLLDINGNPFVDPELVSGVTPHYFFGTSAAAPHAAGMAALLLEARYKLNPSKPAFGYVAMRDTLKKTAINVPVAGEDPATGFDYKSGAGLINAYNALLTEGNPTPIITQVTASQTSSGATIINVVVDGNYLTNTSYITIDGNPVPTTVNLDTKTLSAEIDPFTGNPTVQVCTQSVSESGLDGQCSNTLNILDANRTKITLRAKSYTKTFGQPVPQLDYDLLIGDDPNPVDRSQPLPGGLTLVGLGLAKPGLNGAPDTSTVHVTTAATNTSDAGNAQIIKVSVDGFSPTIPLQYAELYNYVFLDGGLTVEKLHVNIKPLDQTINYGDELQPVKFEYTTPGTTNVDQTVMDSIIAEHNRYIANAYALVRGFDEASLDGSNLAMMITETGLQNANAGVTRANGGVTRANVVDVSAEALNYYLQNRLANGGVTRANGIPFDNGATRANGGVTRANGGVTRANTVVYADAIINGFVVVSSNGGVTRANVSGGNPNAAANGGVTRANGGVTRANYITFTSNGGVTRANVVLNSDPSATPYGFADISYDGSTNTVTVDAISNSTIQNGVLTNSGGDITLVNSQLFTSNSNTNVAVLLDDADIDKGYVEGYISINMVTGLTATTPDHPHKIVPGAYLPVSNNFEITYANGDLFVNKTPMTVTANNVTAKYKDPVTLSGKVTGYVYNPEVDALDDSLTVFPAGINYSVNQVINSVLVPYAGPVYPVGSYTIQPLFAAPANYSVNPPQGTNGTLTIGKADQTITVTTASPASAKYGSSFTVAATSSSGLAVAYTSTAPLSNTGATYTMTAGSGTGKVRYNQAGDANYNPAPEITADVTAAPADLTINMNQSIYYFNQGDPLPSFSSTVNGLVPPDQISDNTYITTSGITVSSTMPAGAYDVQRKVNSTNFPKLGSYNLTNNTATLYVNPSGGNTKAVRPTLVCIEPLSSPVNGLSYRARYAYQNDNSVPVYVPNGPNNYIILSPGAAISGNPPEVFLPGYYEFYIYTNGVKVTWYLASINKNKTSASTSDASSTSNKCNSNGTAANRTAAGSGTDQEDRETIYPNPASNQLYIEGDFARATERDVIVVDVLGRQVRPNAVNKLSNRKFRLDISNLFSSQYFITVQTQYGRKVYKFIKP